MIKVGVADYGMYVWEGGLYDYLQRACDLKEIGYDGMERLRPLSESDAIYKASLVRRAGADFATCLAPDVEHSIQWTSALGKAYVWLNVSGKSFDVFCRQAERQAEISRKWGVETALHNHLGSLVETQDQLVEFMERCPGCRLILDTGHLAVAKGGDPLAILEKYYDRIAAVHVKEWTNTDPDASEWYNRGYFCGLGQGTFSIQNEECVQFLLERGYNGWVFIEHDTHLQDPLADLESSRRILKEWGI